MTREDFEFLDFCFVLLNVADALGIFRAYFEDQGEEFVDDMLSGGGGGDEYGNVGILTGSSWHLHYFHYRGAFSGEHKTQIELLSDMHTILGGAVFGMGWRGKIQLHLEWFRCSRDFFLDAGNTPAERICCALDAAAVIAHEMVHYCQDWREVTAYSLEGFLRLNMADQMQNEVVQLFLLMALGADSWPTDWTVDGCGQTSTNWPCGSHWTTRNNSPCSASGLNASVDTFPTCAPTRQP